MALVKLPVPVSSEVQLSPVVGLAEVLQQTPLAVTEEPPSEVMFPPPPALLLVIEGGYRGYCLGGNRRDGGSGIEQNTSLP